MWILSLSLLAEYLRILIITKDKTCLKFFSVPWKLFYYAAVFLVLFVDTLKMPRVVSISYSEILTCFSLSCEITSYFLKCRNNNMLIFDCNLSMLQIPHFQKPSRWVIDNFRKLGVFISRNYLFMKTKYSWLHYREADLHKSAFNVIDKNSLPLYASTCLYFLFFLTNWQLILL